MERKGLILRTELLIQLQSSKEEFNSDKILKENY